MQMLTGGGVLIVLGIVHGERIAVPLDAEPMLAIAYLVVFGSLIAFSAYGFLLRNVRPAVATSYAYVNPIVAIVLGMSFRHEQLTGRAMVATVLTLGGVFILARRSRH
jgi:drug/metabolite transporter (DMT)-like permease